MAIVVNLDQERIKKQEAIPKNLNEFLKKAKQLIHESSRSKKQIIAVIRNNGDLKRKIEGVISKKIIKGNMIDKGLFLCGIYVPKVFTEYLSSSPKSWIASDYSAKAEQEEREKKVDPETPKSKGKNKRSTPPKGPTKTEKRFIALENQIKSVQNGLKLTTEQMETLTIQQGKSFPVPVKLHLDLGLTPDEKEFIYGRLITYSRNDSKRRTKKLGPIFEKLGIFDEGEETG